MNNAQIVEAILFASDAPLNSSEIARGDEGLDEDKVEDALQALRADYDESDRAFELREVAGGFQIMTRPEFAPYLERFDTVPRPSRLSGPALEALAIVAYRQPISRIEVEYIRGVNSSGVIRTLLDRELVEGVGRDEGVGRPVLYGTTEFFLRHFGFKSLDDLPRPEELPVVLRERISLDELLGKDEEVEEEPVQQELVLDPEAAVAVVLEGRDDDDEDRDRGPGADSLPGTVIAAQSDEEGSRLRVSEGDDSPTAIAEEE